MLVEGRHFEIYDGSSETVYRGTLPEEKGEAAEDEWTTPSVERIQKEIDRAGKHAELSGAIPSNVAGEPAYTLRAAPRHDGGLLGGVEVAWDAANGIPLRGAVYAAGSSSPVLELEATDVILRSGRRLGLRDLAARRAPKSSTSTRRPTHDGEHGKPTTAVGVDAVAAAVDFPLDRAGLARRPAAQRGPRDRGRRPLRRPRHLRQGPRRDRRDRVADRARRQGASRSRSELEPARRS